MSKYPIIVFEGIEASGKSTSLKKVIKYLKTNKINYLSFREPGGTNLSEKLRSLMLDGYDRLKGKLGEPGVTNRAAKKILDLVN